MSPVTSSLDDNRLVAESRLISALFKDDGDAPSPRTIRDLRKRGIIPAFKIGKLVRYDPVQVRAALERHCLVQAKKTWNTRNAR